MPMTFASDIRANLERFWSTIEHSAEIGVGRPGGLSRLALSDADREMRDLFVGWCKEAGLSVEVDELGSIFARRDGIQNDLPPVFIGSHLDTQANGGRFDGIVGVMAGLEIVRHLNEIGHITKRPITIVNWTSEEGARFAPVAVASGAFVGHYDVEWVKNLTDEDGLRFADELERIGYLGKRPARGGPVDAYFELHIEQGSVLDAEKRQVGIVHNAYSSHRMQARFDGETGHPGPTSMDKRRNALIAGARWLVAVDDIGWEFAATDGKASGSRLTAWPNMSGILSEVAHASADVRHPDPATLHIMAEKMRRALFASAALAGCTATIEHESSWGGALFDQGLVECIRNRATEMGYSWRLIASQAAHDAYYMASHCPSAMIFTPCKNGISHHNTESCEPEELRPGLDLLMQVAVNHADRQMNIMPT
jgi:beta-ureidopropionase / N-carbamoyl-L-amino-acid hydrolase